MPFRFAALLRLALFLIASVLIILLRTSSTGDEVHPRTPFQLDNTAPVWSSEELKRDPNIIVVLSEAFWDPTVIPGLTFSRDPIPTFHALQEKYTNGWMLSPQFGGGTANVELEVLTGNSMRFLPENSIAYEQFIKHDVDSMASILARQGYTSTAISPFYNWYFDSSNVYRHFGFSRFISFEYFDPNEYVGPYIGDHAVGKRIIEESQRSTGSDFIFANTMENHYHYWPNKFKRNTIDIKGDMSGEALSILETYAQGANGADAMLQELVEHYSQVKEPTLLVFFGDHLPHLEKDYFVYRESKYISGEDDPDFLEKMHRVPVLIWNNYLNNDKKSIQMSPSFLSPYVLQLADKKGSSYTDFLSELSKKIPIIPPKSYYEAYKVRESDLMEYENRQQHILFGEDSQDREPKLPIGKDPKFISGYGDPVIRSTAPEQLQSGDGGLIADLKKSTTLTVQGGRFTIASVVFADGTPLQTTWLSETALNVVLPKELYAKQGQLELDVKVIDEKNNILGQSQPYLLPIVDKKP
jgi:hypothetical protein